MKVIRTWSSRLIMLCLVILAMLTTYFDVSGVKARDILDIIESDQSLFNEFNNTQNELLTFDELSPSNLTFKLRAPFMGVEQVATSSSNLETAFDWSIYPTKTVLATGYTAGVESTGKSKNHPEYGITYSGVKVRRDLYSTIAADLDYYPIGTILFIPGYGYGVVADKGGAIKGQRLDLYYDTVEEVYNEWGKKEVEVYVVKKGNGTLTEQELAELNENEALQVFRQKYQ